MHSLHIAVFCSASDKLPLLLSVFFLELPALVYLSVLTPELVRRSALMRYVTYSQNLKQLYVAKPQDGVSLLKIVFILTYRNLEYPY